MTSRRYLFTLWLHNQDVVTEENIQETFERLVGGDESGVRFVVGQLEQCPDTGRRHFQCYLEFTRPSRGSALSRLLGVPSPSLRFEAARGSGDQNTDYCTKEDTRISGPWQAGERSRGQGSRTDLSQAVATLRQHGLKRVASDHSETFVKFHRGLRALQAELLEVPTTYERKVVKVYWGSTGTGKTRRAYERNPDLYRAPAATKTGYWFDGYQGQSTVLFDDYGGDGKYPITFLLQLLDGYPMQVPIKGGFAQWIPEKIIITSNLDPAMWYNGEASNEHCDALTRRLTKVKHFQ